MPKLTLKPLIAIILCLALGTIGVFYYRYQAYHPSTDDAYIQAHVIHIAPQVDGRVKRVLIKNHQTVKAGKLLLEIDQRPFIIALNKAKANLVNTQQDIESKNSDIKTAEANVAQAQAVLINTQKNTQRILSLVKQKLVAPAEGDQATSDLSVSQASLAQAKSELASAKQQLGDPGAQNAAIQAAKADVDSAKLNLQYTKIMAPCDGYIADFSTRPGDQLTAYTPIFAVVDAHHWWVDANFKETQLKHISAGQVATITTDLYPKHPFQGTVDSISIGSGSSFSLVPPENATGNWVKVTQRFPVKVIIQDNSSPFPLRLGASATVTIDASQPSA
ncbi:MAG: hypothetical protein CMF55_02510 [Legionellales bacterium]|nr:hypothetical protein [Legionellales bacterium]HAG62009.1 hypothetical protein [Coxiellaceae bacterium]